MNTTLKIGILCVICAAMVMSGCVTPAADKPVLYHADLILSPHNGQGVMEVDLSEDGTATITTITGTTDTTEVGTWQFYRESRDHKMYDIITDDTELRLAVQPDGHTIAYIYQDGFTRCHEPFYGVWERIGEETTTDDEAADNDEATDEPASIISDIIGSITGDESPAPPITVYMDMSPIQDFTMRIRLEADGTAITDFDHERVQGSDTGTWKEYGSSGNEYSITVEPFADVHAILLDDGEAEFVADNIDFEGTWKSGTSERW